MHYEWLDAYLLSFPGVEKDYQPVWQWFRYKVRGRLGGGGRAAAGPVSGHPAGILFG